MSLAMKPFKLIRCSFLLIFIFIFFFLCQPSAFAATGTANFKVKAPFGHLIGECDNVRVVSSGSYHGNIDSCKTGIGLRDKHLRETFKHTDLKLEVDSPTHAKFTMLGQTYPIEGKFTPSRAEFSLDYTKWGIEIPCFMKICVDRMVHIIGEIESK